MLHASSWDLSSRLKFFSSPWNILIVVIINVSNLIIVSSTTTWRRFQFATFESSANRWLGKFNWIHCFVPDHGNRAFIDGRWRLIKRKFQENSFSLLLLVAFVVRKTRRFHKRKACSASQSLPRFFSGCFWMLGKSSPMKEHARKSTKINSISKKRRML